MQTKAVISVSHVVSELYKMCYRYITLRVYSASTQQNNENEKRINKSEEKKKSPRLAKYGHVGGPFPF